jgi:hypothetical protein
VVRRGEGLSRVTSSISTGSMPTAPGLFLFLYKLNGTQHEDEASSSDHRHHHAFHSTREEPALVCPACAECLHLCVVRRHCVEDIQSLRNENTKSTWRKTYYLELTSCGVSRGVTDDTNKNHPMPERLQTE